MRICDEKTSPHASHLSHCTHNIYLNHTAKKKIVNEHPARVFLVLGCLSCIQDAFKFDRCFSQKNNKEELKKFFWIQSEKNCKSLIDGINPL